MQLNCKVNVLGQDYSVVMIPYGSDAMFVGSDMQGYTDTTDHSIILQDFTTVSDMGDPLVLVGRIVRHELVHAFLEESGLSDNWTHQDGQDETIVDWIAIQWPKIDAAIHTVMAALNEQNPEDNNAITITMGNRSGTITGLNE